VYSAFRRKLSISAIRAVPHHLVQRPLCGMKRKHWVLERPWPRDGAGDRYGGYVPRPSQMMTLKRARGCRVHENVLGWGVDGLGDGTEAVRTPRQPRNEKSSPLVLFPVPKKPESGRVGGIQPRAVR
jgi:hypothetical protein